MNLLLKLINNAGLATIISIMIAGVFQIFLLNLSHYFKWYGKGPDDGVLWTHGHTLYVLIASWIIMLYSLIKED